MTEQKPAILGGDPVFKTPLPFARPTLPRYEELEEGFRNIVTSGMVTKGDFLKEYEEALSKELKTPYALGVVNCTIGLYMLLKALDVKGEVIVPSYTFMSTFHVVEILGLTPVFVDCEPDTFTIDPLKVEEAVTPETSAVMGVNIFGNPPDMEALEEICKKHNLKFIMDSAHSFGTKYKGKPMGSFGDGEVFSTSATKLLATGEGGVVATRHKEVYDFIKIYREYGNNGDYDCETAGINGRLSEFHALIGLKSLPKVEGYAVARNRLVDLYKKYLEGVPGITFQKIREGCRSSYKDCAILIDESQFGISRDQLVEALKKEGIYTKKYFSPPGHLQKVYKKYIDRYPNGLKNTEGLSNSVIVLPFYSHMKDESVEKVAYAIKRIHKFAGEVKEKFNNKVPADIVN